MFCLLARGGRGGQHPWTSTYRIWTCNLGVRYQNRGRPTYRTWTSTYRIVDAQLLNACSQESDAQRLPAACLPARHPPARCPPACPLLTRPPPNPMRQIRQPCEKHLWAQPPTNPRYEIRNRFPTLQGDGELHAGFVSVLKKISKKSMMPKGALTKRAVARVMDSQK